MSTTTLDGIEVKPGQRWRKLFNDCRTVKILAVNDDDTGTAADVKTGVFETLQIRRMHNWAGGWELIEVTP